MSSVCARTSACETNAPPLPRRRYATRPSTADVTHTTTTATPSAMCTVSTRAPYRGPLYPRLVTKCTRAGAPLLAFTLALLVSCGGESGAMRATLTDGECT